jgi:hypothetical protein
MTPLKLVALDDEDLKVVSAHVQDALLKVGDVSWLKAEKRVVISMNRFAWEQPSGFFRKKAERRRTVLHFEGVTALRAIGVDPARSDDILSLLALKFEAGEAPSGTVELLFSGGATMRLEVDYIEARLADLGASWAAGSRPRHGA